jgi:hypothetical protein
MLKLIRETRLWVQEARHWGKVIKSATKVEQRQPEGVRQRVVRGETGNLEAGEKRPSGRAQTSDS